MAHQTRTEQLRDRLTEVRAELARAERDEHDQLLRMLTERRQALIEAQDEWERGVKEVLAVPLERRPKWADICAATGLTRQRLEQIRAKPDKS